MLSADAAGVRRKGDVTVRTAAKGQALGWNVPGRALRTLQRDDAVLGQCGLRFSIVLGALIGSLLDIDKRLNSLGELAERKLNKGSGGKTSVAEGFVSASLLFCVGAMSIVGALQSGLSGSHEMLYTKSLLDFVSAIIFASTLGAGVLFSALFVLVYQGSITLLAAWVAPLLSDAAVAEMTCVGSVIIIGLGLNMIGVSKLKVMNFVPAIFLPMLFCLF